MDTKNKKFNLFHIDSDSVINLNSFSPEDFASASNDEKASMVQKHKSISYWRDAWRRFRANNVSMAALVVFILLLIFSYLGPLFIPYSYEQQYRGCVKLGPRQYSSQEKMLRQVLKTADAASATALIPGSVNAIEKGSYFVKVKGHTYYFTLDSSIEDAILFFDSSSENKLAIGYESDFKDGAFSKATPVNYSTEKIDGAVKLSMTKHLFPHLFGTDSQGRDLMSRTMYGARVSIIIGIVAALIVLIIGAAYGAISGLCGGAVDFIMQRIVELIYSVPDVLIVLLLQVVMKDPLQNWFDRSTSGFVKGLSDLGTGIVSIFITFALLYWVSMARIIRGQVLQLKQQEYVTAAQALGAGNRRIIKRHLLPNCVGQLVIATCLQIPAAIFLESFLSFLGMGVSAPMASLGSLCADAIDTITLYPYRMVFPAIILTVLVLSLNLVGDGLRDALDPRLKK